MPQNMELVIPFPARISPDLDRAKDRHVSWLRSFGLIGADAPVSRYLSWQLAELAAMAYPEAVGADLDLAVDIMGWYFLFDDEFDGALGRRPDRAAALVQQIVDIAWEPEKHDSDTGVPLVDSWVDLCLRRTEGMSPVWRRRAAANWDQYLTAYVDEAINRTRRAELDVHTALILRRRSIGVLPAVDLAERLGRYEVPPAAYASALVRDLLECTMDAVILVNEVCSLEKEEASGDIHNLVQIVQRSNRCSRGDAIDVIIGMAARRVHRFVRRQDELRELCAALALPPGSAALLDRYADGMRSWMRGNYDWERQSGRYAPAAAPTPTSWSTSWPPDAGPALPCAG